MKKFFLLISTVLLAFGLVACSGENEQSSSVDDKTGTSDNEKMTKEKAKESNAFEEELNIPDYKVTENFIKDDQNSYSGKTVVELTINGTFDLKDKKIKEIATSISNEESTKSLEKYPDSEMIRVMILQNGEDLIPLLSNTFNVENGKLVLSKDSVSHFPLLDKKQK